MREKIMRFMQGRYGVDQLSRFIMGLSMLCIVLNLFTRRTIFYWAFLLLIVLLYFRIFSRNIQKRYQENQAYLQKTYGVRQWFRNEKSRIQQSKTFHIYKCPSCKQKIRIPRGKGKIEIRCPKCSTTFIKKS